MNRFEKKLKKELETNGAPTQDGYDELCNHLGISSDYVIGDNCSVKKMKKDNFFHFRKSAFVLTISFALMVSIATTTIIIKKLNDDIDIERCAFSLTDNEMDFLEKYVVRYETEPYLVFNELFNLNIIRGTKKESFTIGYFFFIRPQKEIDATIEFTSNDFQTTFLTKEGKYGYINPDDSLYGLVNMTITYNYRTSFMTFSI